MLYVFVLWRALVETPLLFLLNIVMVTVIYVSSLVRCKKSPIFRLEYKGLSHVPIDIPSGSIHVYLNHNNISDITNSPFIDNVVCTTLSMDYNSLMEVKASYWVGLWALRLLSLQRNKIQYIWPLTFSNLPQLEGLYLKDNQIQTLAANIFVPSPHPLPLQLEMTLQRNPLKFDSRLCWIQEGVEDGQIVGVKLERLTSLHCFSSKGNNNNRITKGTNSSEDLRSTTPTGTKRPRTTPTFVSPASATTETDLYRPVQYPKSTFDTLHWVFAGAVVIVVLVIVAVIGFCLLRFNIVSCKRECARHGPIELQPSGTGTVTNRHDSQGYLAAVDEPSQPYVVSEMSPHMRGRFISQGRSRHFDSRPSSIPPFQAPSPPSNTPPSFPLIQPSLGDSDENLEPRDQASQVTPERETSYLYETINDDEITDDYADVE